MKKCFVFLFAVLFFVACEPELEHVIVNDFEDVELDESGYDDGSDRSGTLTDGSYVKDITSGSIGLINRYTYNEAWNFGSWDGFAVSSHIDSITSGYANQYSTIAGHGAGGSAKFALAYDSAVIHLPYLNSYQKARSIMLTNSTWTYYDILKGGLFSDKFQDGDWFKVIIKGFLGANETGQVDFYLADYRDGKSEVVREWTKVSLTKLGTVDKITFSFDSSDKGEFGINTPKYVCVDDLIVAVGEGCDCLKD
ncbi:MAG: DUF4465 domain-containing protein [Paludibacter sp.]|nr:DUF4465 domain-containing protein [Paludibacter sp.]